MSRIARNICALLLLFFGAPFFANFPAYGNDTSSETPANFIRSQCLGYSEGVSTNEYFQKVCSCFKAREEGSARSLKNPICPETADMPEGKVAYQVILDMKFGEIDKEIKAYLKSLQKNTTKDISQVMKNTKLIIEDTSEGSYASRYQNICEKTSSNGIISAMVATFKGISTDTVVEYEKDCKALVAAKMVVYKNMAKIISMQSVMKSYQKDKNTYMSSLRQEYVKFFEKWDSYIAGLGRIKAKWNSKVKNPM